MSQNGTPKAAKWHLTRDAKLDRIHGVELILATVRGAAMEFLLRSGLPW
jgi:hypothetical protein